MLALLTIIPLWYLFEFEITLDNDKVIYKQNYSFGLQFLLKHQLESLMAKRLLNAVEKFNQDFDTQLVLMLKSSDDSESECSESGSESGSECSESGSECSESGNESECSGSENETNNETNNETINETSSESSNKTVNETGNDKSDELETKIEKVVVLEE